MRHVCPHCNEELISMKFESISQINEKIFFDKDIDGKYISEEIRRKNFESASLTCENCKEELSYEDLLKAGFNPMEDKEFFYPSNLKS